MVKRYDSRAICSGPHISRLTVGSRGERSLSCRGVLASGLQRPSLGRSWMSGSLKLPPGSSSRRSSVKRAAPHQVPWTSVRLFLQNSSFSIIPGLAKSPQKVSPSLQSPFRSRVSALACTASAGNSEVTTPELRNKYRYDNSSLRTSAVRLPL